MTKTVIGALAAMFVSTSAHATILVTHWNGIMYSGSDVTDVFGTGNPDLAGVAYDVVVTFDTDKGSYKNFGYPIGESLSTDDATLEAPGTAILTINGHSLEFGSHTSDGIEFTWDTTENRGGGRSILYQQFWDVYGQRQNALNLRAIGYDGYNQASIYTPIPDDFCLGLHACDGDFSFDAGRFVPGGDPGVVYGQFGAPFSLSVPEPASWAMMILGFGLVGATMRSRRQGLRLG